jgi:hypothetical protein
MLNVNKNKFFLWVSIKTVNKRGFSQLTQHITCHMVNFIVKRHFYRSDLTESGGRQPIFFKEPALCCDCGNNIITERLTGIDYPVHLRSR